MNERISTQHATRRLSRTMVHAGLMAATIAFGSAAHAAVMFTFDYGADNSADPVASLGGFWEGNGAGAERQAAMTTASSAFADMFATHFNYNAQIVMTASATNLPNSSNLASAGSEAFGGQGAGFTVDEIVRNKVLFGTDQNGPEADGFVNVNFGQPWHYDLNTTAPSGPDDAGGKYDFYSTIFHEFTHALGFSSSINEDGTGFFASAAEPNQWGTFDKFLVDKNGNTVVNPDFSLNQTVWDTARLGGASPNDGMFFNGSFAKAANGGAAVGLYTPTSWEEGSSVSHTDDDNMNINGTMMTAKGPTGPWPRDYSAIEVAMMQDIGYTQLAAPVPEPEAYAMMLAGLGLIGALARRRKV